VTLGLIKTVLNFLFPFFQRTQDAGKGKLVEHEEKNRERQDFPKDQGRKKVRFKLRHGSHQKGRG
jgi:hypothetical protein